MSFPILVETRKGEFLASLAGAPSVRVVESTRSRAIAALKVLILQRIQLGELLSLDVETAGVSSLAGKYSDDPTLEEIRDLAYQQREVERDR